MHNHCCHKVVLKYETDALIKHSKKTGGPVDAHGTIAAAITSIVCDDDCWFDLGAGRAASDSSEVSLLCGCCCVRGFDECGNGGR